MRSSRTIILGVIIIAVLMGVLISSRKREPYSLKLSIALQSYTNISSSESATLFFKSIGMKPFPEPTNGWTGQKFAVLTITNLGKDDLIFWNELGIELKNLNNPLKLESPLIGDIMYKGSTNRLSSLATCIVVIQTPSEHQKWRAILSMVPIPSAHKLLYEIWNRFGIELPGQWLPEPEETWTKTDWFDP